MSRQQTETETETIEVPVELVEQLRERADSAEFAEVDVYAAAILDRVLWELKRLEAGGDESTSEDGPVEDPAIDESVADRLDSLGYR